MSLLCSARTISTSWLSVSSEYRSSVIGSEFGAPWVEALYAMTFFKIDHSLSPLVVIVAESWFVISTPSSWIAQHVSLGSPWNR